MFSGHLMKVLYLWCHINQKAPYSPYTFCRYHDLGAWDLYDVLNDVAVKGSDEV